jgi:LuxR family maltose regulon positive regulatory protein
VLPRPDVAARLAEATRRRVTVVAAPTDRKTTAVAAWITGSALPVTGSLDESDNELGRFLAYVVGAVRRPCPQVGAATLQQLARTPLRWPAVLASLLNDVAAQSDPLTLVLDDFEAVQAQEVLDAVAFVLEHQPPNLHLVICSRAEPPPAALAAARAVSSPKSASTTCASRPRRRRVSRTGDVAAALARGSHTLHARTEGGSPGCGSPLMVAPFRRRERFIASFAGDHRHVAGYLFDEVLRTSRRQCRSSSSPPRCCASSPATSATR